MRWPFPTRVRQAEEGNVIKGRLGRPLKKMENRYVDVQGKDRNMSLNSYMKII